ncbi:MAG: CPBP family intramembrane glutamic endopeptidase [Verrucomicrobiaceae bacterium]
MDNPYMAPQAPPQVQPPPIPAAEKKAWNAWWTLLWGLVLFGIWQVVQGIGFVIYMVKEGIIQKITRTDPPISEEELMGLLMDGDVIGAVSFVAIFAVCPAAWFLGRAKKPWGGWEYLGNAAVRWWKWPMWLAVTYLLGIGMSLVAPSMGIDEMHESMVQMATSTDYAILLFLGVAIGAPLVEEFMFRGLLFRGWRESRLGLWGTLILTSLIWTSMHVQYEAPILGFLFVFGIILGLAREWTGNVWVPVAMHALNNGLSVIVMLTTDFS